MNEPVLHVGFSETKFYLLYEIAYLLWKSWFSLTKDKINYWNREFLA